MELSLVCEPGNTRTMVSPLNWSISIYIVFRISKIMKKVIFILPILMLYEHISYSIQIDFGLNTKI